jgi:hypothetical protein
MGEITGVLEVPKDFRSKSLVGKPVTFGGSTAMIQRAYTLPRRRWELASDRKRVRFVAAP